MQTIITILKLFTDNWSEILSESRRLEEYLDKANDFLEEKKGWGLDLVAQLFEEIELDPAAVQKGFPASGLYQKISAVELDFPALKALPPNFNPTDLNEISSLIQNKIDLLRPLFAVFEPDSTKLDAVIALVQEMVAILFDIPDDFDFNNIEAVTALKNQKVMQLKLKMFQLIEYFFEIDLTDTLMDKGVKTVNNVSDILIDQSQTEVEDIQGVLSTIKDTIPQLKTEFDTLAIDGLNTDRISQASLDLLSGIEARIPELEQQFADFDWDNPSAQAVLREIKELVNHLWDLLDELKTKHVVPEIPGVNLDTIRATSGDLFAKLEAKMPELAKRFSDTDLLDLHPASIVGTVTIITQTIDDLISTINYPPLQTLWGELKIYLRLIQFKDIDAVEALTRLKNIFTIPETLDLHDLKAVINLINARITDFWDLLACIEIEGVDTEAWLAKAKSLFDELLDVPTEAGLDSISDLLYLIYTRLLQFAQKYVPWLKTGHPVLEQFQKVEIIWSWVNDSGVRFSIKEKEDRTAYREHADDRSSEAINPKANPASVANESEGANPRNIPLVMTDTEQTDSQQATEEIPWREFWKLILGDEQSGIISLLKGEPKEIASKLLAGTMFDDLVEEFKEIIAAEEAITQLKSHRDTLMSLVNADSSPQLGDFLAQILAMALDVCLAIMRKLQQILLKVMELLFNWILFIIQVIKNVKIPREWIPEVIYDAIVPGDEEPNLLCLLIAMPVSTLKRLMAVSVEDVTQWCR